MPPSLNLKIGRRAGSDVVGLDIQPGLVAAVQARVNGAILAERAVAAALPADAMREGDVIDPAAVTEALRELFAGSRLGKRVRVGVANQRTVMRTLELPPVSDPKELAAAVQFQAQDQIPMPLASAVMDFHALGVVDTPAGPRQKVVVVAAQRDMIERLLAVVRGAGLTPVGVDLSAFAMIRALHGSTPDQTGRVLYLNVDGLTNVAIAEGTVCRFTRVVGGGFEEMAVQLAERRGIPLVDARALLASVDLRTPAPDEAPASHAPYAGDEAPTGVVSPELPGGGAPDDVVVPEHALRPPGAEGAEGDEPAASLSDEEAPFAARKRSALIPGRKKYAPPRMVVNAGKPLIFFRIGRFGMVRSKVWSVVVAVGDTAAAFWLTTLPSVRKRISDTPTASSAWMVTGIVTPGSTFPGGWRGRRARRPERLRARPAGVRRGAAGVARCRGAARGNRPGRRQPRGACVDAPAGRRRRPGRRGGAPVRAVNLLPADQRIDASIGGGRSQGAAYAILALLGGVALLALLYGMARHQISSRRAKVVTLNAKVQQIQGAAQRLAPYTSFVALREERVLAVSQLVEARFDWAHAFHELGRVLPNDASVTSLEGSVGSGSESGGGSSSGSSAGKGSTGASGSASSAAPSATSASSGSSSSTVASATPPGSVPAINLSGCATSQAEVARTLNRLRLIDGVSEVTLQSSTKSTSGGSSSSSGSSAKGQCSSGPSFTIQLTFEPLPAAGASAPSAAAASAAGGGR